MQLRNDLPNKFDQLFVKNNLFSKTAEDGNVYSPKHTEVQTLRELMFTEVTGALEADITKSFSYNLYYSTGGRYENLIDSELIMLARHLGIQFDVRSNFRGKLIVSYAPSIEVLQNAGVVHSMPAVADAATQSISLSLFYLFTAKPSSVNSEMLASDINKLNEVLSGAKTELEALNERKRLLDAQIETVKKRHDAVTKLLNDEPLEIRVGETPEIPVIGTPKILESFYILRKLIEKKFAVGVRGIWRSRTNTVTIKMLYSYDDPALEMLDASRLLHAIGSQVKIDVGAYNIKSLNHHLNQGQFDAAIIALNLLPDKTADEINEITHRL